MYGRRRVDVHRCLPVPPSTPLRPSLPTVPWSRDRGPVPSQSFLPVDPVPDALVTGLESPVYTDSGVYTRGKGVPSRGKNEQETCTLILGGRTVTRTLVLQWSPRLVVHLCRFD